MNENKSTNSSIGDRLRMAREMAGLTQAQAAKLLGLHRPSISEIEAGRRKVSAEELAKLSEVYAVNMDWILGSEDRSATIDRARLELAARELSKLKPEDLDRVLRLLSALRQEEDGS